MTEEEELMGVSEDRATSNALNSHVITLAVDQPGFPNPKFLGHGKGTIFEADC